MGAVRIRVRLGIIGMPRWRRVRLVRVGVLAVISIWFARRVRLGMGLKLISNAGFPVQLQLTVTIRP